MPIGFEDLLQTTAQFASGLNKGVVSTDHTFGGVRSKIDDWTDLHLSTETSNGVTRRTFQDDGTTAAPGNFKPYSTIFYVADGRALVETASSTGAIRLNASGEFVSNGGQLYTHGAGTPEPGYYVYTDATATGGTGTGTDKLPKFNISGSQGSGSTALPAGYQKFSTVNNTSGVSLASAIDTNLLSESSGELDLDLQTANTIFAGPTSGDDAAPAFRALALDDITDHLLTLPKLPEIQASTLLGRASGASPSLGDVQELNAGQVLTILGVEANAQENVGTDLSSGGFNGTTQQITSSTGTNVNLLVATAAQAGIVTNAAQTFAGSKVFNNNVSIGGNLSVAGTVTQSNSQEVNFNDTRLRLNIPTSLLDNTIEDSAAPSANTNVGLEVFNGSSGGNFSDGPLWVYNYTTDHWGASVQGSETTLDNVKAFKFDVTTSGLGAEANATNDIADLYGTSSSARSNDTNIRSVGAVSKCTIDITTDSSNSPNNFAPVAAAANGYPIQHDLDTSSVFVFALKTHQAGAGGTGGAATAIAEPQPVFCKFKVLTSNIVEVSVGITIENEKYDIIVIG